MKPINAAGYRAAVLELLWAEQPQIVVEVGVYAGDLSKLLSAESCVIRYTIVDSWAAGYSGFTKEHMDMIAGGVIAWASTVPKIGVWRMDSISASRMFNDGSVDFFHTDGDHTLEGITGDIVAWLPKVRAGGIMSGDNYEAPTVAGGVDRLLPQRQIAAKGRLWWARV